MYDFAGSNTYAQDNEHQSDSEWDPIIPTKTAPSLERKKSRHLTLVSPSLGVKKQSPAGSTLTSLESEFKSLALQWKDETKFVSSTHEIVMNLSYQSIIGMGKQVLPLILNDLEMNGGRWFWALKAITRANPVKPGHAGDFNAMRLDWLNWAAENNVRQVC